MKFEFIISKWANFYFFISNLSEWHFSNRKEYNILWRKELGNFSAEEENALKKFKEIRSNYPSGKTFFEQSFFQEDDPWQRLKNNLPSDEYKILKDIFDLFKNKFEVLYKNDLPFLEQWQKELEKTANEKNLVENITKILGVLFNTSPSKEEVKIYLLFSTSNHAGGGANIDEQSISVEISRYPVEQIKQILGIIWHETTHLLFQNYFFFSLLLKHFPEDRQMVNLINEATISALFPKGILGIRLLKNKPAAILCPGLNATQTVDTLNLVKEYVDQNKQFNEIYLEKILAIIKVKA